MGNVRFGSPADVFTNTSGMSACGGEADAFSARNHDSEGPVSARSGHSLTVNDDPLDHRMTSMPVRRLLVGVADAAKQCLIEVLADELDAIGQTVFRESAG